ncbi:MAG: hypothetical protein M1839_009569 [Geoglossum umbratile]|nr:MAG: hypothetical protein M1839_009569 [Geoglossum umbratile]
MHKSSSTSAHRSGGGLLSKTGSLFGTRSAAPKPSTRSVSSRPGTSGGSSTVLNDQGWHNLDPFSPTDGPGLRRTTSTHSAKDLNQAASRAFRARSPSIGTAVEEKPSAEDQTADASPSAPSNTSPLRHRSSLSSSSIRRKPSISRQRSTDSFNVLSKPAEAKQPESTSSSQSISSSRPPEVKKKRSMFAAAPVQQPGGPFGYSFKVSEPAKPSSTSHSNAAFSAGVGSGIPPSAPNGLTSPHVVYQHIHEMASKRISTLDYLRKAHEGRVYWFNTLLFTKQDLAKISYFEPKKLSRRATNYLLLGLSIPTILEINSQNPFEYLRALNALLSEFENFQQVHPPDGTTTSSLSRARLPAMFKRATHSAGGKGRRTSSAAEIGLPISSSDPGEIKSMSGMAPVSTNSSFPSNDQELLPGEEYTYLLTPSLPFDPDFYETFATLCDVLIDCYTRVMNLINSPALCTPSVHEMFSKADAKVRKVIVSGVVREFEDWSRTGVKTEIAGVGKVVLGGLI